MLRYIHSHYFYNGFSVGLGVMLIGLAGLFVGGEHLAGPLIMGAVCVSLNDNPTPVSHKFAETAVGLVLTTLVALSTALLRNDPWLYGANIMVVSFIASMMTAYGKKALPLNFSLFFAMVLTLSAPIYDKAAAYLHVELFACGGALYLVYATLVARRLSFRTRQQALGECIQSLAGYLKAQADFFEAEISLDTCYTQLISRQVAVADRLQTARDLVFRGMKNERDGMLAATLTAAIELFEYLLSAHTDYARLRELYARSDLMLFFRDLSLKGAQDLEHTGLNLMQNAPPGSVVTYKAELYAIEHEMTRLRQIAGRTGGHQDPQAMATLVAMYDNILHCIDQIERLRKASQTPVTPEQATHGVNVALFLTRPKYNLQVLIDNLRLSSPVFRYTLRTMLAMACGYGVDLVVPYTAHGYWIILTIAVIMRSSFSVTRQRQLDRIVGNLVGCLLAAFLLWETNNPVVLIGVVFAAVGVAHAFATVNYRYTAVATCVMGLVPMHFFEPSNHFLIAERLMDTAVGAAIAYTFSFILPNWESTDVPRLVGSVVRACQRYVRAALDPEAPVERYRLSRKRAIDAIAALGAATRRMQSEPQEKQASLGPLNAFVTASYLLVARVASVRILLQHRAQELETDSAHNAMNNTSMTVCRLLGEDPDDPGAVVPAPVPESRLGELSADVALIRRLDNIIQAAQEIGDLAPGFQQR